MKVKPGNSNAIYDDNGRLCCFGGGHDLAIYTNCTTSNSNYSNLPNSYETPNVAGVANNCVLTGSYNFKIDDLEVW